MNQEELRIPQAALKKRYGVITARIGTEHMHTLGIEVELNEPDRSVWAPGQPSPNAKIRSAVDKFNPRYRYIQRADEHGRAGYCRSHALPGALVMLVVEDISRLPEEYLDRVEWKCFHHGCAGKKWPTKDACVRAHPNQKELRDTMQTHLIVGVLEIAGTKDQKDKDGKVVSGKPALLNFLSDEE